VAPSVVKAMSPSQRRGGRGAENDDGPRHPGGAVSLSPAGSRPKLSTRDAGRSLSPKRASGQHMAPPQRPGSQDGDNGDPAIPKGSSFDRPQEPTTGMSLTPPRRPGGGAAVGSDDDDDDDDDEHLFLQKSRVLRPDQIRQLHGDDMDTSQERSPRSTSSRSTTKGEDEDVPIAPSKPPSSIDEFAAPPPLRARRRPTTGINSINSLKVKDDVTKQEQIRKIIKEEEMSSSLTEISPPGGLHGEDGNANEPMNMPFPGRRNHRTSRHGEVMDDGGPSRHTGRGGSRAPAGRGIPKKPSRTNSSGLAVLSSRSVKDDLDKQVKIRQIEEEERLSESRSRRGRLGEDDEGGFGRGADHNNYLGEEKKDLEMTQISVQDYQALVKERDELRETAQQQADSISELNKQLQSLKTDINVYIERDEKKNDELEELEDRLQRVSSVGGGFDVGALTEDETQDPLANIELLKVENDRLNKKASYLAQRSKTNDSTIKELEDKLVEVCYGAIDRERELQELLVKDPWEQIVSSMFSSWKPREKEHEI
jgi:hypothetical protein